MNLKYILAFFISLMLQTSALTAMNPKEPKKGGDRRISSSYGNGNPLIHSPAKEKAKKNDPEMLTIETPGKSSSSSPTSSHRPNRSLSGNTISSLINPKLKKTEKKVFEVPRGPEFKPYTDNVLDAIMQSFYGDSELNKKIRKMMNKNDLNFIVYMAPREGTHQEVISGLSLILGKEPETKPLIEVVLKKYVEILPDGENNHLLNNLDNSVFYALVKLAHSIGNEKIKNNLSVKMWTYISAIDLNHYSGYEIADSITQRDSCLLQSLDHEKMESLIQGNKIGNNFVANLFDATSYTISLWFLSADDDARVQIIQKMKDASNRFIELENAFGSLAINMAFSILPVERLKLHDDEWLKASLDFAPMRVCEKDYRIPQLPMFLSKILELQKEYDEDKLYRKLQMYRTRCGYADNELSSRPALTKHFENPRNIPLEILEELAALIKRDKYAKPTIANNHDPKTWNFSDYAYFFKSWDEVDLLKRLLKNGFFAYAELEKLLESVPEADQALMLSMWLGIDEALAFNLIKGKMGSCIQKAPSEVMHNSKGNFANLNDISCNIVPAPKKVNPLETINERPNKAEPEPEVVSELVLHRSSKASPKRLSDETHPVGSRFNFGGHRKSVINSPAIISDGKSKKNAIDPPQEIKDEGESKQAGSGDYSDILPYLMCDEVDAPLLLEEVNNIFESFNIEFGATMTEDENIHVFDDNISLEGVRSNNKKNGSLNS